MCNATDYASNDTIEKLLKLQKIISPTPGFNSFSGRRAQDDLDEAKKAQRQQGMQMRQEGFLVNKDGEVYIGPPPGSGKSTFLTGNAQSQKKRPGTLLGGSSY